MNQLPPTIRKAAVLVSALDSAEADALLEQMHPEAAARVRSALVELGDVSAQEQEAVLAEFFRGERDHSLAGTRASGKDGVELELSLPEPMPPSATRPTDSAPIGPLDFVHDVPALEMARVLFKESAQTIAVVVARLAADRAALVLEQLPSELAIEVLERMAWLREPAPEVLHDIARQLQAELASNMPAVGGSASVTSLQALLGAMDQSARRRVLAGLSRRNASLARQLGGGLPAANSMPNSYLITAARFRIGEPGEPAAAAYRLATGGESRRQPAPLIEFEDFQGLGDDALRRIFAAANPQVALLALTGAPEPMLARILSQLSPRDAATLRTHLNHPGAVRLSDIQGAQQRLADLARRLAEEGTIRLPASRHFAAAA